MDTRIHAVDRTVLPQFIIILIIYKILTYLKGARLDVAIITE